MAESVVAELGLDLSSYVSSMRQGVKANDELNTASKRLSGSLDKLSSDFNSLNLGKVAQEANRLTTSFHTAQQTLNTVTHGSRAAGSALNDLAKEMQQFRTEMQRATAQAAQFGQQSKRAIDDTGRSAKSAGAGFASLRNLIVGIGFAHLAKEAIETTAAFNTVQRTLHTVTGSAVAGAEAFAFVRRESQRLGTDLLSGATAYARFANAAKNTAFEGENTRKVFSAFSEAVTALGLGTDEYRRIMIATTQVMTKGKIQTEELLQFSEAGIPVFKLLSEAIGITGEQLSKALQQGKVPAEALLLVAEDLHEQFFEASIRNSETLEAKFRVLTNTVGETVAHFGNAIFRSGELKALVEEMTTAIAKMQGQVGTEGITLFTDEAVGLARQVWGIFSSLGGLIDTVKIAGTNLSNEFKDILDVLPPIPGWLDKILGTLGAINSSSIEDRLKAVDSLVQKIAKVPASRAVKQSLEDLTSGIDTEDISIALENRIVTGVKSGSKIAFRNLEDELESVFGPAKRAADLRSRILGDGTSDAESKKAARDAERAAQERSKFVLDILRKRLAEQEKLEEKYQDKALDAIKERVAVEKAALKEIEEAEKKLTSQKFNEIKDRAEREQREAQRAMEARETRFNREKEIHEQQLEFEKEAAESRVELFENAADNVSRILERVAEDDWIGAIDGFFRFATDGLTDLGRQFEAMATQGFASGRLNARQATSMTQMGQGMGTIGAYGSAVGSGIGVGAGAAGLGSQLGLSSGASGALGGALGGATAAMGGMAAATMMGASLGSVVPIVGTIIGAAVGALLGAFAGGAFGGGKPPTFAEGIMTSRQAPMGGMSDEVFRRSAFGALSFPEQGSRGLAGFRDLDTIAKLDNAIASLLNVEQRILASEALADTRTGEILGEDFGSAAGNVIAERISQVLKAVLTGPEGEAVAARFLQLNPRGSPEEQAQLAGEFFGIVKLMTDAMDTTELTEMEAAVKAVREEFAAARPIAQDFGFSVDRINQAEQARIDKLRQVVDEDISDQLASIKDPFSFMLKQMQEEAEIRLKNVRAVGGDIAAALELNTRLQRQAIQAEMAQRRAFAQQLQVDFLNASNQSQAAARLQLKMQTEMQIQQAKQMGATQAQLALITKTYWANLANLNQSFRQSPEARPVGGGGRPRQTPRTPVRDTGPSRDEQAAEFRGAFLALTNPFKAAMEQMSREVQRFRGMADKGIIGRRAFQQFIDLSMASARAGQALAALGGRATAMDQLGDAFGQFINLGRNQEGPLAQFRNEMMALNEEFVKVSDAAKIVGLSTRELEVSYLNQSKMIKERLLQAIDQQLSAQIEGIESINDFLRQRRVDETLPGNIRVEQAQLQFRQALQGSDAGETIRTGEQLISIARQQFASSDTFFNISRMVEASLSNFAAQQQQAVNNERARLMQQAQYQLQTLVAQSNSLNVLRAMDTTLRGINNGMSMQIDLARENGQQNRQNEAQLRNLALIIRNRQWK